MARNAIKSDFRSSKMATGGHFVKKFKKKLRIDLNGGKSDRINFWSSKMAGHFVKKFQGN